MIKINERGDTIVEVMISLAVLAAVMGSAYAISNRALIQSRSAQERLQATKLAERQLERLKVLAAAADPYQFNQLTTTGNKCINPSLVVVANTDSACTLGIYNYYFHDYSANIFTVKVEWNPLTSGATKNIVDIKYRIYR
jgi:Tfp pilus assembly protein PilV